MKKILVILIVVLLLAGGGAGAYWWFVLRGAPAGSAGTEAAKEPPPEPHYVELDSLTIPVIRGGAVAKYVLLKVTLEVAGADAQELVESRMPLVQDAFLRDLHAYFAARPVDAALNVRAVKKRLMGVGREIVGEGRIVGVLIQGAFEKTG